MLYKWYVLPLCCYLSYSYVNKVRHLSFQVVNKFGSYVQFYNLYQLFIGSLSGFKVSINILKLELNWYMLFFIISLNLHIFKFLVNLSLHHPKSFCSLFSFLINYIFNCDNDQLCNLIIFQTTKMYFNI